MAVRILLFAAVAEAIGSDSVEIEQPLPITAGELAHSVRALAAARPGAAPLPSLRVAVNKELVDDEWLVMAGDEVAVVPPFAGG